MGIKINFNNPQEAQEFDEFREKIEDHYERKKRELKAVGSLLNAVPITAALGIGAYLAHKKPKIFKQPFMAYAMGAFTSGAAATSYGGLLEDMFVKHKLEKLDDEKDSMIKSYLKYKKIPYEYTTGDYKYKVQSVSDE